MTGLLFGAMLLATAAAWWLLATRPDSTLEYRIATRIVVFTPPLLFSAIVALTLAQAPAGEYRVALEGIDVLLGPQETLTIGGGSGGDEADDFIIDDLPPGFLTFRGEGGQTVVELPEPLSHETQNPEYAVVRVDGGAQGSTARGSFANSVELDSLQDAVLVTSDRQRFAFDPNRHAIAVAPQISREMAERTQGLGRFTISVGRNLAADVAMFPLRFLARATDGDPIVTGQDGAPLGSFLAWGGGYLRRHAYATLVDDGTAVHHRAGVVRYERRVATIGDGQSVHVALFRVNYADPNFDPDVRSRVQERRSFDASYKDGRLRIVLDTPVIVRLSPASVADLPRHEDGSFLLTIRAASRATPVARDQMQLSFRQLGPRMQNELHALIRVNAPNCDLDVTTHTGQRCSSLGEGFRVGDDAAAMLRVTELGTPWGIVLTLVALAGLAWTWVGWHRADAVAIIVTSASEVLLAIRLLIAYDGAIVDSSAAPALWESVVVYAIVPLVLRVTWSLRTATRGDVIRALAMTAAAAMLVGVALLQANVAPRWIAITAAVAAAAPILVAAVSGPAVSLLQRILASPVWLIVFTGALLLIRAGLWFGLGWKERATLGADLALTVFFLPASLLYYAGVWGWYRSLPAIGLRVTQVLWTLALVVCALLLTIGMPAVIRDLGSVLVQTPALVLLFALPMLAAPAMRRLALAVPLVLMLIGHGIVIGLPSLRGQSEILEADAAYERALAGRDAAEQYFAEKLETSNNVMRINEMIAPHAVEQAGTSRAEGLVAQRRILDRYNGQGWSGAGYLNAPLSYFRDTHLNDHVSAIHVLAPFGAIGALGLTGLLASLAIAPLVVRYRQAATDAPEDAIDRAGALGILALWTFCLTGLYMIAANIGLVLFTGKNLYLLAAASNSDALEGGILLLLVLLTLASPTAASRTAGPLPFAAGS